MVRTALLLALVALASCGGGDLGPPESYRVLVPVQGAASKTGLPVVKPLGLEDPAAQTLVRLFEDGFASEMLRTVYLAKQLVREGQPGGKPAPGEGLAIASAGLPVVLGLPRDPYDRGPAVERLLRAPLDHPQVPWLGLPADLDRDKALVQTVAGLLATYALRLAVSGGTFAAQPPTALDRGYRMAM